MVSDIAAAFRDILVFHLGAEEAQLADDARLAEDLGADRLDLVEIAMSCEERFNIDIPNRVATRLATVGDAVRFVEAQVAGAAGSGPARRPVRRRPEPLVRAALHACLRFARRRSGLRGVLQRTSSTASSV
jgi:acyl carrier protein